MLRFRLARPDGMARIPMSPLIDITFLLLIFFMLNLKIIAPEGNFDVQLPSVGGSDPGHMPPSTLHVSLKADDAGELASIRLGTRDLGAGPEALRRLTTELRRIQATAPAIVASEWEVEIDADYELHYEHIVHAISACTADIHPDTKQSRSLFRKIKFAPPHQPKDAA